MLYAELNINGERIIYPFPVPENKKPYKVERILEGSEIEINGIYPLNLYNGTLIYVREVPKSTTRKIFPDQDNEPGLADEIRRYQVEVKKSDTEGISAANAAMQSIIDEMQSDAQQEALRDLIQATKQRILEMANSLPDEKAKKIRRGLRIMDAAQDAANVIKEHAVAPEGNLYGKLFDIAEAADLVQHAEENQTKFHLGGMFAFTESGIVRGPGCSEEIAENPVFVGMDFSENGDPVIMEFKVPDEVKERYENRESEDQFQERQKQNPITGDRGVIIEMQIPTTEQVTKALEEKMEKPFAFSGGFEFVPPVKREYEPEVTTCKHPRTGQIKGFTDMWCYTCRQFVQPQNK